MKKLFNGAALSVMPASIAASVGHKQTNGSYNKKWKPTGRLIYSGPEPAVRQGKNYVPMSHALKNQAEFNKEHGIERPITRVLRARTKKHREPKRFVGRTSHHVTAYHVNVQDYSDSIWRGYEKKDVIKMRPSKWRLAEKLDRYGFR